LLLVWSSNIIEENKNNTLLCREGLDVGINYTVSSWNSCKNL